MISRCFLVFSTFHADSCSPRFIKIRCKRWLNFKQRVAPQSYSITSANAEMADASLKKKLSDLSCFINAENAIKYILVSESELFRPAI